MNFSAKTVVVIAIGAALYGIGGLPMFGIPVFANTTLKPAMAVLALFSVLFGPLVGFLVGFIGHWVTDLFSGWGVWLTWVLGSGIVGFIIGLFPKLTKARLEQGLFPLQDFMLFSVLALVGNIIGYGTSALLDTILYAEPFVKVFAQLTIIAVGNSVLIALVGYILLNTFAKRKKQSRNLVEAKISSTGELSNTTLTDATPKSRKFANTSLLREEENKAKTCAAIEFSDFSFKYASQQTATLQSINLRIEKGEKIVIIGPSGSGKSTLGQCLNGLIPHAVKGEITGNLSINGKPVSRLRMQDYSEQVGTVLQDTDSQFVGLSIGEDIAFSLENKMVEKSDMLPIVVSTAAMVELDQLLEQSPYALSGGQKQRVSLAGILVDDADILLFDEPLASLDPKTGKTTIEIIDQLHRDSGKTVVIIEHRLEEVLHRHVDRVILMDAGKIIADLTPDELIASPLLQRHGIREPLYISALKSAGCAIDINDKPAYLEHMRLNNYQQTLCNWFHAQPQIIHPRCTVPLLEIDALNFSYTGDKNALENISFTVNRGEFVSILGKNGSGKSTITKLIMGVIAPDTGCIRLNDQDIAELSIFERAQKVGVVMQNPNHMISNHMIFDEVAFGLRNRGHDEAFIEQKVVDTLALCGLSKYRHWPIDALSYGQKKRVTIASILVLEPELLILDEPTAGQDHRNYTAMLNFIKTLNKTLGITVLIISHDMHLVLQYTTRSIVIAESQLIANAPVSQVFSDPALLDRANLNVTSLYTLANKAGITDTDGFMQQFIASEVMPS